MKEARFSVGLVDRLDSSLVLAGESLKVLDDGSG